MNCEVKEADVGGCEVSSLLTGSIAWVLLGEQPPEHNERVLVYRPNVSESIAYQIVRWWIDDDKYTNATHWARLTPPEQ